MAPSTHTNIVQNLIIPAALICWMAIPAHAHEKLSSENDVECLALNIYFEARNEPVAGQLAVGHVVLNRVADLRFPDTICGVVRQGGERRRHRCQFSWWCDGKNDQPVDGHAWRGSKVIATNLLRGLSSDPTRRALWYHADYVTPSWSAELAVSRKIGRHIFYTSTTRHLHEGHGIPARARSATVDQSVFAGRSYQNNVSLILTAAEEDHAKATSILQRFWSLLKRNGRPGEA